MAVEVTFPNHASKLPGHAPRRHPRRAETPFRPRVCSPGRPQDSRRVGRPKVGSCKLDRVGPRPGGAIDSTNTRTNVRKTITIVLDRHPGNRCWALAGGFSEGRLAWR